MSKADLPDATTVAAYLAVVRPAWGCELKDVWSMAWAGMVLRSIERIAVNAHTLPHGPAAWLMGRMSIVESRLRRVLCEIDCEVLGS